MFTKSFYKAVMCLCALALCGLFYSCEDKIPQVSNPTNPEILTGNFLDEKGKPVANVTVEAMDAGGNVFSSDVTDADGFFEIKNVPYEKERLTNGIISFVATDGIVHQEKLEKIVEQNRASNGKIGNVLLGGDNDCETVFKLLIKDFETKELIPDAAIMLGTSENAFFHRSSDANGAVAFPNICPGKYILTVAKQGYNYYHESFVLIFKDDANTLQWEIELYKNKDTNDYEPPEPQYSCCTNSVFFYVIDEETGEKLKLQDINGTTVTCYTKDNRSKEVVFHNDGLVEFKNLCVEPDEHLIEGVIPGYKRNTGPMFSSSFAAWIDKNIECGKDITLEPLYVRKENKKDCVGSISLNVLDYTDSLNAEIMREAVAGAKVHITYANTGQTLASGTTDNDGYISFPNLQLRYSPDNIYMIECIIEVTKEGYVTKKQEVGLNCDSPYFKATIDMQKQ